MTASSPVHIRVPASSANIGPGYDSFGLALARYDEVTAQRADAGLSITVEGVGADSVPTDESHLVVQAAHRAFDAMRVPVPGMRLHCINRIPHGGGQGSSAAAIVAGILMARALTPDGAQKLSDDDVFALATDMEGHPDNVAPVLFGGFTVAWMVGGTGVGDTGVGGTGSGVGGTGSGVGGTGSGVGDTGTIDTGTVYKKGQAAPGPRAVRLSPDPRIRAIVFTAEESCATSQARAVLPLTIPHADAAANSARAALLVHALTSDPALLFDATEDYLHQRYREEVMPHTAELLRSLRGAGLAAVLSGAGPSVLLLGADLPDPGRIGAAGFHAEVMDVPTVGALVDGVPLGSGV